MWNEFSNKQTLWKHIISGHKRRETLAHFHTLFNSIYQKDVCIFNLLSQLCEDSNIALKHRITFNFNEMNKGVPERDSPQEEDLKTWEHEQRKEAHESWNMIPQMVMLHEKDQKLK